MMGCHYGGMTENNSPEAVPVRFSTVTITLHWMIVLVVLSETLIGVGILHFWPNTAVKIEPLTAHLILGFALLALVTAQIVVRFVSKRPQPASSGSRFLDLVAKLTHALLYLLTLLVAASGVLVAVRSHTLGLLVGQPVSTPMEFEPFVHAAIFALFGMLVGLHVLGAFYHQFVLKDRLWSRMGYGRPRHLEDDAAPADRSA